MMPMPCLVRRRPKHPYPGRRHGQCGDHAAKEGAQKVSAGPKEGRHPLPRPALEGEHARLRTLLCYVPLEGAEVNT
jgi:hypothetical protein